MLIYGNDKEKVCSWIKDIKKYVEDNLDLEFKVIDRKSTNKAVSFLGYRISSNHIKLNIRSMRRYKSKMAQYHQYYTTQQWSQEELKAHLIPLVAFIDKAKSFKFANNVNSKLIWN